MKSSRVQFSGFQLVEVKDTDRFDIETGMVQDGGVSYALTLLRPAGTDMNFSTGEVKTVGRTVWRFRDAGFTGPALLVRCGERLVIALVGRDSRKVEKVVPLASLAGKTFDLTATIRLKQLAAKELGRQCLLTELEQKVADRIAQAEAMRQAQAANLAREVRERANAERVQERLCCIAAIMSRPCIVGYGGGQKRTGVPVVAGEWKVLKHNTFVILVESIGEDGMVGPMIESFVVTRKGRGSEATKGAIVRVTVEPPQVVVKSVEPPVKPVGSTAIERDHGIYSVMLFKSLEDIRRAQRGGLNSGTFAAVDKKDGQGKLDIVSVHHDRIESVGKFAPFV